jgi:cell division protein FtsZ
LNCGPEVSLLEVNRVMAALQAKAPAAAINLGVAVQPEMSGQLGLTLVIGLEGEPLEEAPPPLPVESPVRSRRKARREAESEAAGAETPERDTEFLSHTKEAPAKPRFIPPAPNLTNDQAADLMLAASGRGMRGRRTARKVVQGQLPLEIISKGRFEKSEPTLHHGENLDEPTYIRRGVVLN